MIWIIIIVLFIYIILIGEFGLAHWRLEDFKHSQASSETKFTLIIPFRNEAINLPQLLSCIEALEYPKDHYEVILVNDASQDHSLKIVNDFISNNTQLPLYCIENNRQTASPKKDAITTAIQLSKHHWIVTTDADCAFPTDWLQILSHFITKNHPKMVVGPVRIASTSKPDFLNAFEQLDFLSLMGATIGGFGMQKPFLCNGAHLAYKKEAFMEVNGFSENDHIASGDDHFLLEKFNDRFPSKVMYLKTPKAVITTLPQKDWSSFISQRVRWAAKSTGYTYWFSKLVGIIVFITNLSVVILLVLLPLNYILWSVGMLGSPLFAKAISLLLLLFAILSKFIADYLLIARTASFLDRRAYLKWFPLIAICYAFVSTYIAMRALTGGFVWKGRRYKR